MVWGQGVKGLSISQGREVKLGGRETRSSDMHRHSYSLLRYGQTVYTGGAAHSRPQAEAEEMKKDLETIISFMSEKQEGSLLEGSMAAAGFRESAGRPV
jgi:hypothetical protein